MKRILKFTCVAFTMLLISNCTFAQKPTKEDITIAMKKVWDKPQTGSSNRTSIAINDIKIGTSEKSNYAQQLEGVPKGALVTYAKIDFTQSTFDPGNTQKVRRIMTGWVYKDQFGELVVMNIGTIYPGN